MLKQNFEELPQAIQFLGEKFSTFEALLLQINEKQSMPHEISEYIPVEDAAKILCVKRQTIYRLISSGILPAVKKTKRNYILRSDLDNFLKSGKREKKKELSDMVCINKKCKGSEVKNGL